MLYPILVVISFVALGLQKIRRLFLTNSILTIIILLVFFIGILNLLHVTTFYINLLIEGLVLVLLLNTNSSVNKIGKPFRIPGGRIFGLFTLIIFISVLINKSDLYQSYLYFRFFLTPFLFMLIIVNINLSEQKQLKLIEFIEYLFVFQIIATVFKLFIIGRLEHPIGTIIIAGGGVATYLPLIAAGFLLSKYYIYNKNRIYLYLLFAFPIIAFASQKRGAFIFLPIIFILFIYILGKVEGRSKSLYKKFKYFISLSLMALFLLAFASKTTRTMNPENTTSGSFDLSYLFESSVEYNTLEGELSLGRFASFKQVNNVMLSSDLKNKIFGFGPETLKGINRGDGRFEKFGVGGTYPGISYQFIQIGILGGLLCSLIYLYFGVRIYRFLKIENDRYWKSFGTGSLMMIFLFFIDYFTYSITFLTVYAFSFSIAIAFGIIMKRYYLIVSRT